MLRKMTPLASSSTVAVAARVDVARVHRQQQHGDELRDQVGELVGGERADQPAQQRGHRAGTVDLGCRPKSVAGARRREAAVLQARVGDGEADEVRARRRRAAVDAAVPHAPGRGRWPGTASTGRGAPAPPRGRSAPPTRSPLRLPVKPDRHAVADPPDEDRAASRRCTRGCGGVSRTVTGRRRSGSCGPGRAARPASSSSPSAAIAPRSVRPSHVNRLRTLRAMCRRRVIVRTTRAVARRRSTPRRCRRGAGGRRTAASPGTGRRSRAPAGRSPAGRGGDSR